METRTCHEPHGYCTPPVVIPNRNEVALAVKINEPPQSNWASFFFMLPGMGAWFRNRMTKMPEQAMIGRLIQKIHRQLTFCAKPAPSSGPITVPTDQTALRTENLREEKNDHHRLANVCQRRKTDDKTHHAPRA